MMKEYLVHVDYVTTATLRVMARDEDSAYNKAERYINTRKGIEDVLGKLERNVPEGFEIVLVEEE